MRTTTKGRLAIVGAGPIGLEAALAGLEKGFEVQVFEKGRTGEHVLRWGHVRMFSPFGMNVTPAGRAAILATTPDHEFPADDECLTGRQLHAAYLDPLAKSKRLRDCLHLETQVVQIGRHGFFKSDAPGDGKRAGQPFLLLLRSKGKEQLVEADVVLDCSGTYGQHRWCGDGGVPAVGEMALENQIVYGLDDVAGERRGHYLGKSTLVIGGGYSAATTVCALAELARHDANTWTTWLTRTTSTQPLRRLASDPLKERDRLAARANALATRGDGNVEFHGNACVRSIQPLGQDKGYRVTAILGKQERAWDVDRIVANVGYAPDGSVHRELHVHECYATEGPMKVAASLVGGDCLRQTARGPDALRNPEPNFFILGAKSYGRDPHFLLRTGFEQVRDVIALL